MPWASIAKWFIGFVLRGFGLGGSTEEPAVVEAHKAASAETELKHSEVTSETLAEGAAVRSDADQRVRNDTEAQLDADPHGHWIDSAKGTPSDHH